MNISPGRLDKFLLGVGLALSALGLALAGLGQKDSAVITILGFTLSIFSYFGMRFAQLTRRLDLSASVHVITDEQDNFQRSRDLVAKAAAGGRIFATSTFLGGDADATPKYRNLVNLALARNIFYQKVICFGDAPKPDRLRYWSEEIRERQEFLLSKGVNRDLFELLHYPGVI